MNDTMCSYCSSARVSQRSPYYVTSVRLHLPSRKEVHKPHQGLHPRTNRLDPIGHIDPTAKVGLQQPSNSPHSYGFDPSPPFCRPADTLSISGLPPSPLDRVRLLAICPDTSGLGASAAGRASTSVDGGGANRGRPLLASRLATAGSISPRHCRGAG